ncbi:TldE-like protein [Candidatus Woesearchaeota archaeon]|nr:TldE-like protein [Candidatus Woesearchaeota archaeon]|tara:strand:- start:6949 stop:8295 length:1347 start_codon:yes stop_codon:yes gene_type:complete
MNLMQEKETVAKSLLDKFAKAGANDVIVHINEDQSAQIKFANSKIATTQSWTTAKAEVFVAVNKRLVTTTIKDFSEQAISDSVSRIMKFANSIPPTDDYGGIAEGPFNYKELENTFDSKIIDLNEKAVDMTEAALNAAEKNGSKRSAGVLEWSSNNSYLLTTNNIEAEDKATKLYFSLRAFVDKYASGHRVCNSRILSGFNPEEIAAGAAETARQAVNPVQSKEGVYDVLFEPLPFSNILTQIGESFSIFNVESHLSCLAGKIGQQVADKSVTITDDGTLPNGYGSGKFDAEGVPTQKNVLIEDGVLKTFLHNTSSAKRHNVKTTANAGLISPSAFNVVFNNGKLNKEEIISTMKKGLIVTNVWYTRFQNYADGDFSTIPRDGMFMVENGKITGAVKELRISDNLLNILKNVAAIGSKPDQVFGWEVEMPVTTPPVLVKDVHFTKSVA